MSDPRPDATPSARPERRSSVGRLLDKFKSKKRNSSQQAATTATTAAAGPSNQPTDETKASRATEDEASRTQPMQTATQQTSQEHQKAPAVDLDANKLEDVVPLPSRFDRFGRNSERTRALFEKYGYTVAPSQSSEPLAEDQRKRVEKSVRIRIHWTCHECQRTFANEKTCNGCGHRRCRECVRSPPKKAARLAVSQEARAAGGVPVGAASVTAAPPVPMELAAATDPVAIADKQEEQAGEAGATLPSDEEVRNIYTKPQYTVRTRPRTGYHYMDPAAEAEWRRNGKPTDVHLVATVQRVYKKPRQRIRYTCEHCRSTFVDRYACRNCGHQRCEDCVRYPPKRAPPTTDPELLKAVEDRLAAMSMTSVSVR